MQINSCPALNDEYQNKHSACGFECPLCFPDEDYNCSRCDGNGSIMICCDDMCQGLGECIHGDGEIMCPVCEGAGY